MPLPTIRDLFENHKEEILQEVSKEIASLPWSPYQQFLIHREEGQCRLRIFMDLFGRALAGERKTFLKDQERIGYTRALMEGWFRPEDLTEFYTKMPEVIWNRLQKEKEGGGPALPALCEEIQQLNGILLQGYSAVMRSYLNVREERITEKVIQLQELQRFTREIIALLEPEQLAGFILPTMKALFGAEAATFCLYRNQLVQGVHHHPADVEAPEILSLMERTHREKTFLFTDGQEDVFEEIDRSSTKRVVSAPILAHGTVHGVLCLWSRTEGFPFTHRELEFLKQFLYIMAVALEKAFMLKEVEQAREALSLLTGKMITIQEEERRRVAADIHDTLTQTLIGISYKIQFCKEIPHNRAEMLEDQLDSLLRTVDGAIDQSRNLISSLRPDLIDTMGLVPALERHVKRFVRETGIRVKTSLPEGFQFPCEINICLFRVAQEALMNIYKHAETTEAEIRLRAENGKVLFSVRDRGKGFVCAADLMPGREQNKLGLLSMKERVESIGGRLTIESGTHQGCCIHVDLPLPGE